MLGTGAAMVRQCYNTCFTLSYGDEHFLVDGGGGNGLLVQLEKAGIAIHQIHNVFISHNHSDHILGLVWLVRAIAQEINKGRYEGTLTIYGHTKSLDAIRTISQLVMQAKLTVHFGQRIALHPIADNYQTDICDRHFHFFDIRSTKELQHGFVCSLHNGKRLAFAGDEPIQPHNKPLLQGAEIIMQEAYCLYSQVDEFNPYPKCHGTVKDSAQNAQELGAQMTILFHTEGKTLATRKQRYTAEGMQFFGGELLVPDDLEVIELG